jgi:hypothetical protein
MGVKEGGPVTVVIGVDPHKQTHTAVAVRSGTGEVIDERTAAARTEGHEELLSWAQGLSADRLWALEDVRSVSRGLERLLVARGERVVRVPPKLMAGARRGARSAAQHRAAQAGGRPRPLGPPRPCLSRAPAGRRQDPTRSAALPQATVGPRRLPPPAPDAHELSRTRRQDPRRKGSSACSCLSCRSSLRSCPPDRTRRVRHLAG